MHEVLARLLAVRDDIHTGVLLRFEPHQCGVALRLREFLPGEAPRGPELARFGEPRGLGQAAGDRGLQHGDYYRVAKGASLISDGCDLADYRS